MIKGRLYKKYCDGCEEFFRPTGKGQNYCKECKQRKFLQYYCHRYHYHITKKEKRECTGKDS